MNNDVMEAMKSYKKNFYEISFLYCDFKTISLKRLSNYDKQNDLIPKQNS